MGDRTASKGIRNKKIAIWRRQLRPFQEFWLMFPLVAVPQVSKAAADLMTYCDAHACEDPLITPVPTSENPFREKKFFCALL